MITISNFLFFILGALFIQFFNPIIDMLCSLILTKLECIKGHIAIKITEQNHTIRKITEATENQTSLIGFAIDPTEEECEDYDDE